MLLIARAHIAATVASGRYLGASWRGEGVALGRGVQLVGGSWRNASSRSSGRLRNGQFEFEAGAAIYLAHHRNPAAV